MSRVVEIGRWFMLVLLLIMPIEIAIATGNVSNNTPPPYPEEITIIADIPEWGNSMNTRLNGTTVPGAVVDLYRNGNLYNTDLADETGAFVFRNVLLDRGIPNNITLVATRQEDGLTGQTSGIVQVDDVDPEFTSLSSIPAVSQEQSIVISGNVSEPAVVVIELNDENDDGMQEVARIEANTGFSQTISLSEGNTEYRITAYDRAQNDVIETGFIYVDTTAPRIIEDNIDQLSPTYSRSVTIRGKVSEEATVQIVLDGRESGAQCSDGIDNDQDGKTDYPFDLGCNSPEDMTEINPNFNYECSDGIDNDDDEDTIADFPYDLGCDSPTDDDETDYAGEDTQCNDGIDNDQDGFIDYNPAGGGDWGCTSLDDNNEGDDPDVGTIYTTKTDVDGNFKKEVTLPISYSSTLISPVSNSVYNAQDDGGTKFEITGSSTAIDTDIQIKAIDRVGQVASREGVISYSSCSGGDGGFVVFQTGVYPASILPDHIFQGIAQISFQLELESYLSENIESIDVDVAERPVSVEDEDKWDFNVFNADRCSASSTPDQQRWYVTCQLERWPPNAYQNITSAYDDFEEQGKISIPLNLLIRYTVSEGEVGDDFRQFSKTQIVCYDMEFPLDIRLDPDDIPTGLLNASVELLDKAIKTIDQILPIIAQVKWIVFATCLGMMLWMYLSNLQETASCWGINEDGQALMETAIKASPQLNLKQNQKQIIAEIFKDGHSSKKFTTGFIQEEGAIDAIVNTCFAVKERVILAENTMQGFCDRIFCPAIPSAQKYHYDAQIDDDSTSACADTFSTELGQIFAEDGTIVSPNKLAYVRSANTINANANKASLSACEQEYKNTWDSACYGFDPIEKSKELEVVRKDAATEGSELVNRVFSGLSICTFGGEDSENKDLITTRNGVSVKKTSNDGRPLYQLGTTATVNEVDGNRVVGEDETNWQASDITYDNSQGYDSNPYLTTVDGCVVALPEGEYFYGQSGLDTQFYTVENLIIKEGRENTAGEASDPIYERVSLTKNAQGQYMDKSGLYYTVDESTGKATQQPYKILKKQTSSRNDDVGFRAVEYDPSKANSPEYAGAKNPRNNCYSNNAIAEQGTSEIIKDPTGGFINSLQCVCLPAIEGYLINIRNILLAIKNCFESILISGEFDAGVCKAILTQYLCDFVYDLLGCVVNSASFSVGGDQKPGERPDPLTAFFTDLKSGGDKIKESTSKRYGDAKSFQTLFNERQVLRSVCLAAFGYDWQPDLQAAISTTGGGISINSTGIIAPATRRFNGYDPVKEGLANNIYHIGYFLTAGEPLAWRLELICSTTNNCDPQNFANGVCDCAQNNFNIESAQAQNNFGIGSIFRSGGNNIGDPTIGAVRVIDGGQLEGGQTVGSGGSSPYGQLAGGQGSGDLYVPLSDPVRYDRVRLCWQPTSGEGKPGCVGPIEIRQTGGNYPPFCSFSFALGKFSCGFFNQVGAAYISDVNEWRGSGAEEPGEAEYAWDTKIQYEVNYALLDQGDAGILTADEEYDHYLRMEVIDENGVLLWREDTAKDELLTSGSRIVYPFDPLSPRQLTESSIDVLYGSGSGVPNNNIQEATGTMTIRSLDTGGRILAKGNEESYLVFRYKEQKLEYTLFSKSALQTQLGSDSNIENYVKDYANFFPANMLEEDSVSGLPRFAANLGYEDTEGQKSNLFTVDLSSCTKSSDVCYRVFTLRPDSSADSLTDRCIENNQQPLAWKTKFTMLVAEKGTNTRTQAGASSGQSSTETVPLAIACQSSSNGDGNSGQISNCPIDQILTSECLCGSSQFAGGSENVCTSLGSSYDLRTGLVECPESTQPGVPARFVSYLNTGAENTAGKCQITGTNNICDSGQMIREKTCVDISN